jgi:uncharacterized C2H2 Zn-finger protein
MATASSSSQESSAQTDFRCPECGRTFTRAAALGAHRRQAHGVLGASAKQRTGKSRSSSRTAAGGAGASHRPTAAAQSVAAGRRAATAATAGGRSRRRPAPARVTRRDGNGVDRDRLLGTLFPNGIPAREEIVHAANQWLDEAERLTHMR